MWPFKKKEKAWKPKSWIDYTLLGIIHGQQLKERARKELGKRPQYTPSKIITGDTKLDFDLLKEMHSIASNAANTLNKIKQLKMNQKDNQQTKGLRELMGNRKEEPFNPLQREALFPRELLQPLYEKWKQEYATNGLLLAEDFYRFLLMQSK